MDNAHAQYTCIFTYIVYGYTSNINKYTEYSVVLCKFQINCDEKWSALYF